VNTWDDAGWTCVLTSHDSTMHPFIHPFVLYPHTCQSSFILPPLLFHHVLSHHIGCMIHAPHGNDVVVQCMVMIGSNGNGSGNGNSNSGSGDRPAAKRGHVRPTKWELQLQLCQCNVQEARLIQWPTLSHINLLGSN